MRILFIDDYDLELELLKVALMKIEDIEPSFASGLEEIPKILADLSDYSAVVTDFRLVGHTGDDVVKFLREQGVAIPMFLLSGSPEAPAESNLYDKIYKKPFTMFGWVDVLNDITSKLPQTS